MNNTIKTQSPGRLTRATVITLLLFIFVHQSSPGQSMKNFTVDFSKTLGTIKPLANVTAGPGESLVGYKDARIKMIRTNDYYGPCDFPYYTDFFKGDTINPSFNPADTAHYFWHDTDSVLTINNDNGFETFFRLGISFDLTETSPYWDPPYDYGDTTFNNISEVFKKTAMHYNGGWNNGYHYNIKYWNVWTEPDGNFWNYTAPAITYFRMYKSVSNAIKNYDPNLLVGGAGFLSPSVTSGSKWIPDFIDYCKNNSAPLDFLSWHLYMQFNPYAVYVYSTYIRGLLDGAGMTGVKSIITETNIDLGVSKNPDLNSPKGAAWFSSMLIAAQMAPLDRLIMYRGNLFMNLLQNDVAGQPSYTWNGLGFKSFSVLADEAPIQIDALGSEFISDTSTMTSDTTNLMILASKTTGNDSCYVLISNYNSTYTDYSLKIKNLPWTSADSVVVTGFLTDSTHRFIESTKNYAGGDSVIIDLANMNAPSVILLKITRLASTTGISVPNELVKEFSLAQNYPNPFNPSTQIKFSINKPSLVTLKIYDVLGKEIKTLVNREMKPGVHFVNFDASNLPSGIYFYRLSSGNYTETKKMSLLK